MRRLVSIDGRLFSPEEATVSVYDRGFLYGDAVFETLRTYGGVPFGLDEHVARLAKSAARLKMRMPIPEPQVRAMILEALDAARTGPTDDGYTRIILTRGSAPLGLDVDLAKAPRLVILVEPLAPPLPYDTGIRAVTIPTLRAIDGTSAAGAKVTNYLAAMLALAEAKAQGAQEALLLDAKGRVVEGTTSNVFAVKGGVIRTPPEDVGLLVGITRAHVLASVQVELAELRPEDLYAADEVFITSSLREVIGVVAVDGRTIGAGVVGPETRRVHAAFRARLPGYKP
jgi:branched-chain amino acid aminotransferase